MKILESFEEFNDPQLPLVLTIGNFDGMHRGHAALLNTLIEITGSEGQSIVITFSNHPSEVLRPESPVCQICTLQHKLRLLQNFKIHKTIVLTFTQAIAQRNAANFIESLRQSIPFTHLVLGHDATLGRDKQGSPAVMQELGEHWGFVTTYVEEYRFEAKPVSSSRVREAIRQGNLGEVEALLNRPYSILAPVVQQKDTIVLNAAKLCLFPQGTYPIKTMVSDNYILGTAKIDVTHNIEVKLNEDVQNHHLNSLEIVFL